MQPLEPTFIAGSSAGLVLDRKPYLLPDQAYQTLENAYVWRDRVKKREGLQLVGRLRRLFSASSLGNSGASPWSFNIYSTIVPPIVPEANAEIDAGSVVITIQAGPDIILIDNGDGTLDTSPISGVTGIINYMTGDVTITGGPGATPTIITFGYFPGLPAMGIFQQEESEINEERTIFFDTVYAYIWNGAAFQEFIPGTIWSGTDADFFWCTNYRGSTEDVRLFFATNNVVNAANPIRYTDNAAAAWTSFIPAVSATNFLFQARILIPYYGRLLALNTWEGTLVGNAVNFFNRCRFSQIGSPIAADAWRSDLFGKGGFIDAPTNEEIVGVTFFKNTLIVGFERSTWQLRYVGEYGLPFIWERISSDFGTESTFSPVLFDQGVLSVGDRAIIASTAVNVDRIDSQIPDIVFSFQNAQNGVSRVQGIRDFKRELVFWCYPEYNDMGDNNPKFPNKVLLYNYKNQTYAIFRDNVTCFGTFQDDNAFVTWGREDIFWGDEDILWADPDSQSQFPFVVSGNQQGFIHLYGYVSPDDPSLAITAVDLTTTPVQLTVPEHNLFQGEIIYLSGMLFDPDDPELNDQIYSVVEIDQNTIGLAQWNGINYGYVTSATISDYIGNGRITLFPKLRAQTKDFNPYQTQGKQLKISYIDFLTDATPSTAMTVKLNLNSSSMQGNLDVGNQEVETSLTGFGYITNATQTNPCQITSAGHSLQTGDQIIITQVLGMIQLNNISFTITVIDNDNFTLDGIDSSGFTAYVKGGKWVDQDSKFFVAAKSGYTDYCWHRFYATEVGQYINIEMTYDDVLMNDIDTHRQTWILNALALYTRPAGKIVF